MTLESPLKYMLIIVLSSWISACVLFPLRFSHSPLIDDDDEEEEAKEPMLNEAFGKTFLSCFPLQDQQRVELFGIEIDETGCCFTSVQIP